MRIFLEFLKKSTTNLLKKKKKKHGLVGALFFSKTWFLPCASYTEMQNTKQFSKIYKSYISMKL